MSLLIDSSLRAAALGLGSDAIGIESRARAAVDLFLNGAAARKRG
jgi:hypothetical protein